MASVRPRLAHIAALALAGFASFSNTAAAHDFWPPATERARYLMGTICTATSEDTDTTRAAAAADRALETIARLEPVMSSWRSDSELARFNAAASTGFECSEDLFAALAQARVWAESTGGAFDPTIEPLNHAWDMRGVGRVPEARERDAARALVGWRSLELDPATRRARLTRVGMGVDLGGIGKGIALDRAVESLRADSLLRARVDFGGQVATVGAWEVLVADPRDRLRPSFRVMVENASLSTSAQSERGTTVAGKHHGHILDPRTGKPVEFAGSVSVLARTATTADALSTALLVMGREQAGEFAARHPDIGVLWLETARGRLRAWKWNLAAIDVAPDARVSWMN